VGLFHVRPTRVDLAVARQARTRVVLLAHWLSDVLVGLAVGAGLEHGLAALSREPHSRSR